MRIIKIGLFIVIICIFLAGCNKKTENPIIGEWTHGSFIYTFNKDGTCTYNTLGTIKKCTYKINENNISILYEGTTVPFESTYTIKDNKLNIKDSFGKNVYYEKNK